MRFVPLAWAAAAALCLAVPAPAHAQSAINLSLGGFVVTSEDARADGDVLFANREILDFAVSDFNSGSVGIDWLLPVGEFFEIGAGAQFTNRRVPTVYDAFVNRNGNEIEQDLRLRIVPLTATVRVLPFGRSRAVQPYFGGGVGLFNYRYSEVGEFVDFTDRSVFTDRFVAEGNETGGVILAGIRFPIGDVWSLGGEVRYQNAKADLSTDFFGSTLDLSGVHYLFTAHIKF